MSNEFALRQYTLPLPQPFETSESLQDFGTPKPGAHHDESWPVLYILTNSRNKTAYIGQTTNYQRRMKQSSVEKVGVEPDPKRVGPASWNLEYG